MWSLRCSMCSFKTNLMLFLLSSWILLVHSARLATLKLIEEVELRPILYDKGHMYHKITKKTGKAWLEVAKEVGESADDCKDKFKNLKDTYRKKLKDSSSGKAKKPWVYMELLHFLRPQFEATGSISDIPPRHPPASAASENTSIKVDPDTLVLEEIFKECPPSTSGIVTETPIYKCLKTYGKKRKISSDDMPAECVDKLENKPKDDYLEYRAKALVDLIRSRKLTTVQQIGLFNEFDLRVHEVGSRNNSPIVENTFSLNKSCLLNFQE